MMMTMIRMTMRMMMMMIVKNMHQEDKVTKWVIVFSTSGCDQPKEG